MAVKNSPFPGNPASQDNSAKNEATSLRRKLGAASSTIKRLREKVSCIDVLEEKRYQEALEKGALRTEKESMKKILDRLVDALAIANVDFPNEIQELAAQFGNERQELSKDIIALRERIALKENQILDERAAGKSWYPEFVTRTALSDAERIRRLAASLMHYRTRATLARNSDLIAD